MQPDLFTYLAQLLNFALLVYLLRRFLYQPIARAMAAREAMIAEQFQAAATERARARTEADLFHEKRAELETTRTTLLDDVQQEVATQRTTLLAAARAEIDAHKADWEAALADTEQRMQHDLQERIVQHILQLTRHLLDGLADVTLEEQMVRQFLYKLQSLDAVETAHLRRSFADSGQAVEIWSAFPLEPALRTQIAQTLEALLTESQAPTTVALTYHPSPSLLAGIELRLHDYQLAWTLRNELAELELAWDTLDNSPRAAAHSREEQSVAE